MGRGVDFFFDESSKLSNRVELEPELERNYRARARQAAKRPRAVWSENMARENEV